MLMQRVLTAVLLIPPVIAAVWFLPTFGIALLVGGVFLVGAWEWTQLARLGSMNLRAAYVVLVALVLAGLFMSWRDGRVQQVVLLLAAAWWLLALIWVMRYPKGLDNARRPLLGAGVGAMLLGPAFLALVALHGRPQGPLWILFLLVLIWAADTGAYFAGRGFGKHKLAARVSPAKTWEGVAGGLLLSLLVTALAGILLFHLESLKLALFLLLCSVVVAFSVVGDLTESMFKRQAGVKDSGTLFPGHGGVLDRLDSLLAAAPLFLGGLLAIGI